MIQKLAHICYYDYNPPPEKVQFREDDMQMARIFLPPKHAMQSGRAKMQKWLLELQSQQSILSDPLMGWQGGGDTIAQVRLHFDSAEAAIAYAEKHNIVYVLETPKTRHIQPKSYAANFSPERRVPWTH